MLLLLQSAVDTTANASAGEGTGAISLKFIDLAMKGGWIMIPILVLSVVAVFIFLDRYRAIKKANKLDRVMMNSVKLYISEGRINEALELCKQSNLPVARMLEKGITRIGRPTSDVMAAIDNIGSLEIAKLEKGLPVLASVAGGAPMIGFLGTVMGMIRAFYDMAQAGNNIDVQLLSSGIYQAMVTTVAGLIVGIIAYFAYNILVADIEKVIFKMEAVTSDFMDLLNDPSSK
ncbi:MAG: MotA/TolQ/ExbB proton channel family protein [Bacteroidales bacterium]